MTMLGLDEAVVRRLVAAVDGEDDVGRVDRRQNDGDGAGDEAVPDRFARGTFGMLAEPGDSVAGLLVGALGAAEALSAVVRQTPVQRIVSAVHSRDPDAAVRLRETLPAAVERWRPRVASERAIRAFEHAAHVRALLIIPGEAAWPSGVDDLQEHAPLALWLRGDANVAASMDRSIALVGARAATGYGTHVAADAAAGLVDRGYAIISGAAYGIDGMAHESALASRGMTAAFLAGGVDRFYPSGHHDLLTRIVQNGAVYSELPCGSAPTKWRFLQRNRLIAACSSATVVLEAGHRSGSLNTAGHAATLGRPLGAVPGPVTSPASSGCHRLIRDYGAQLVTSADEMAALARGLDDGALFPSPEAAGDEPTDTERRLLDALSRRAVRTVPDLAAQSGLSVAEVGAALGLLQLAGTVMERRGGWVRC